MEELNPALQQAENVNKVREMLNIIYLPGHWDKKFCNKLNDLLDKNPDHEFSEKQMNEVNRILYTYRKQLKHKTT